MSNIPDKPDAPKPYSQKGNKSDELLDSLLMDALPEPPLPGHLQQQILNRAHTSLADRILNWIIGDMHWWRPASAGLTMLFVGYLIGASTTLDQNMLNQNIDFTGFEDSFTAGNLITLNEEYEVYDEQF